MHIHDAAFVRACSRPADFPAPGWPEIAFVGRSNVGKSSLINLLLGRRGLARVSATPGKTQTINFIAINRAYYFVDLPGYGYAKVPGAVQQRWRSLIDAYFRDRSTLRSVVLILDPRRPPTDLDRTMNDWLDAYDIPAIVAATKADHVPRGRRRAAHDQIAAALALTPDRAPVFLSARTGEGRGELWARIDDALMARPPCPGPA
jgi:GTP-binding protein